MTATAIETQEPGRSRPIMFKGYMARAVADGRKRQTRRLIWRDSQDPGRGALLRFDGATGLAIFGDSIPDDPCPLEVRCRYGNPGDHLWVKETWRAEEGPPDNVSGIRFEADSAFVPIANTKEAADHWLEAYRRDQLDLWRSPLFLPRWASRSELVITNRWPERLQAITEHDARWEGIGLVMMDQLPPEQRKPFAAALRRSRRAAFAFLWDAINGHARRIRRNGRMVTIPGACWESDPWVWRIEFERRQP